MKLRLSVTTRVEPLGGMPKGRVVECCDSVRRKQGVKIVTRDNSLVVLQRDRLLENEVNYKGPKGGPHGPLYTKGTPRLIILIKPGSAWLYLAL